MKLEDLPDGALLSLSTAVHAFRAAHANAPRLSEAERAHRHYMRTHMALACEVIDAERMRRFTLGQRLQKDRADLTVLERLTNAGVFR